MPSNYCSYRIRGAHRRGRRPRRAKTLRSGVGLLYHQPLAQRRHISTAYTQQCATAGPLHLLNLVLFICLRMVCSFCCPHRSPVFAPPPCTSSVAFRRSPSLVSQGVFSPLPLTRPIHGPRHLLRLGALSPCPAHNVCRAAWLGNARVHLRRWDKHGHVTRVTEEVGHVWEAGSRPGPVGRSTESYGSKGRPTLDWAEGGVRRPGASTDWKSRLRDRVAILARRSRLYAPILLKACSGQRSGSLEGARPS